jgi:hypothetical protein
MAGSDRLSLPRLLARLIAFVGAAAILGSVAVLAFSAYQWMRIDVWPDFSMAELLQILNIAPPNPSWTVLRGLILWVLPQSAAVVLFVAGCLVLWLGLAMIGGREPR